MTTKKRDMEVENLIEQAEKIKRDLIWLREQNKRLFFL